MVKALLVASLPVKLNYTYTRTASTLSVVSECDLSRLVKCCGDSIDKHVLIVVFT